MKLGVQGSGQWPEGIPDPGFFREIAVSAEELGYDSIWLYDHFHNVPQPAHEAVFECWTTIAALAEASREAVSEAVADPVADQLAEIAGAAQRAMAVSRQASERLTRQLLTMSETAAAIASRTSSALGHRSRRYTSVPSAEVPRGSLVRSTST